MAPPLFLRENLGRMSYADGYARQVAELEAVFGARGTVAPVAAKVLVVEHEPVITATRRPGVAEHLLASRELLASMGVAYEETDRGGDITYHGPGQIVLYPIIDLNLLNLGLHDYMRLLEDAVISVCEGFGVPAARETGATGVWVPGSARGNGGAAKICAMGVRVRRWISMHGLALNVTTNLEHFGLIVPCGLAGRPVTSLEAELGARAPGIDRVQDTLVGALLARFEHAAAVAAQKREGRVSGAGSAAGDDGAVG